MSDPTLPADLASEVRALQLRLNALERSARAPAMLARSIINPDGLTPPESNLSTGLGDPTSGSAGPELAVAVPPSGQLILHMSATWSNPSAESTLVSLGASCSGANTQAASSTRWRADINPPAAVGSETLAATFLLEGLNPGWTTFRLRYQRQVGYHQMVVAGTAMLSVVTL